LHNIPGGLAISDESIRVLPEPLLPSADQLFRGPRIAVLGIHDQKLVDNLFSCRLHLYYFSLFRGSGGSLFL
jgi:hypothetical protein